jgi:hypothetical protein
MDTTGFVADLKRNDCLAGARGQGQEDSTLPLKDALHSAVDRDFLIVAGCFS